MPKLSKHKGLDIFYKAFIGFVAGIIFILLLLQLLILLPSIQNKLKYLTITAISKQFDAKVSIGQFRIGFPKKLKIDDVLISTTVNDTLVYVGNISLDIGLIPLLRHQVVLRSIGLKNGKGDFGKLLAQIPADTKSAQQKPENIDASKTWVVLINELIVESCKFRYNDKRDLGFNLILDIGKAKVQFGNLNFEKLLSFQSAEIDDTFVSYETFVAPGQEEDSSAFEFADIRVGNARLANCEFAYIDSAGAILFSAKGQKVETENLLIDITHEKVAIDNGFVQNTTCAVAFMPTNDTTPGNYDYLNWGQYLWRVEGNEIEMKGFNLLVDYPGEPELKGHFNNEHLNIGNLSGKLASFVIDYDNLIVEMHQVRGNESNGLEILNMDGKLNQIDSVFTMNDLEIQTKNGSYLVNFKSTISPTNYIDLSGKYFDLSLDIQSKNMADIDYFYPLPVENTIFKEGFRITGFDLITSISGYQNDININELVLKYLDSTEVEASGKIQNFASGGPFLVNLNIEKLITTRHDLNQIVMLPATDSSFSLPDYVILEGEYLGLNFNHSFTGKLRSDIGSLNIVRAEASLDSTPWLKTSFSANLRNLKKITHTGIASADFSADLSFSGKVLYSAFGDYKFNFKSLNYNEYKYQQLNLEGMIEQGNFSSQISSSDTNALFKIDLDGRLAEERSTVHADMNFQNIDLKQLNLISEPIKIKGGAEFTINYAGENEFGLNAAVRGFDLGIADTIYKIYPASLNFQTSNNHSDLDLESSYYNLRFTAGDYILDVFDALAALPDYYLTSPENDSVKFYIPDFKINGNFKYPETFAMNYFPGFPAFKGFSIDGFYSKAKDELVMDLAMPGVDNGQVYVDSLYVSVTGNSKGLRYRGGTGFTISEIISGSFILSGAFENSKLLTRLQYSDSFSNPYLDLTAQIINTKKSTLLHFLPKPLIFSYDNWEILPGNEVEINPGFIKLSDFSITNNQQHISITSFPADNPENIELKLTDFSLGSLEQLFALDTLALGVADADFKFYHILGSPVVEGTMEIDNLDIFQVELGRLNLSKFMFSEDHLLFDLTLEGDHGNIATTGLWQPSESENPFDFNMKIDNLNIAELNYLLSDYITDAKGKLEANLKLSGKPDSPVLSGKLSFSDAGVGIKMLNNYFTLGDESIAVADNTIRFSDFTMTNKQDQSAKINGMIAYDPTGKIIPNLRIISDNMVVMNSTKKHNDLIFGLLKAKTDVEIIGTSGDLKVGAEVTIDESTDISYVFPDMLSLNDNQGIVEYDKFDPEIINDADITENSSLRIIPTLSNFKSRIKIRNGTKFQLYFDSGGEDYLKTSLNGYVNYTLLDGNIETSGMFELTSGQLHYSLPMVAVDKYEIEPGSFITLSNDLYNPYLNLIASSKVRASTEGLMPGNAKVMNFKVLLYMTGELNDVQLKFDVSPETSDAIVSARLMQLTEEERNVNALNLLVRGSFMFSLQSDELGGTSSNGAQIDKFYASNLNHLISDNIGFVDLKFDVQSFRENNSSGSAVLQRNFYYNIGKSFLNDRAKINYKGSMGITSDRAAEQINSHFVQNELEIELKITADGNLKAVFFRKNEYEGLMEGEIIQTGGGLRFSKEFYSVGDIFTNEKRQQKKLQKADIK